MKIIKPGFEFITPIDGSVILKRLEECGRVCYKSEGKITDDSAPKFVAGIIKRGHEAVLEHCSFTVKFICDRGVSHEIVRHRLASYCQESTRYCNYGKDQFGSEITVIEPCYLNKDTFAYDEEGRKTQKAREDAAKERIFSILPEDQKNELIALFDEFEDCETSESKYAHAMDNLQPLLLNHSNNGDDWKQHQITSKQVYGRQSKTKLGSERLYEITDHLIQDAIKKGFVKE